MKSSGGWRSLLVGALAVTSAAAMTGCTDADSAPTGGLAVIVGARNNMPPPMLDGEAAQARDEAVSRQSYAAVVVADGQPFVAMKGPLIITAENDIAHQKQEEENRQRVNRVISTAQAKMPETDLLSAIELGARTISGKSQPHTVVVVDSGISTAGAVNFTRPGMVDVDPAELADALKRANELPDLSDNDVVFQGLGDTAPPQQRLTHGQREHVIAVWTAIVKAAGARSVEVEQSPLQGAPKDGLPPVKPVDFGKGFECSPDAMVLTGGDVAFQPDSAEFIDPSAAAAILKPIAEQIRATGAHATITGTTANVGNKDGQHKLSGERAQAVADVLMQLGVPAERLTVVGLGSDFPGYVQDSDASGRLIPEAAAMNRKVIVQLSGAATLTC